MVDTVRTIAQILALFADNTSGDISPQDARDMIVTLESLAPYVSLSSALTVQGVGFGDYYLRGFYDCPAADSNLTQASTTQTYGAANESLAAHAVCIAAAAGATNGTGLVLTVTGTSITDAGVRTTGDSEVIVPDCTASVTDQYYETTKKWLGQVTYTLSSAGGATTYNFDFNYGFAAYDDLSNTNFVINSFSFEWFGGATDAGFDIEVHKHETTGWTYHATAFNPGSAAIYMLTTDHATDNSIISGKHGKWKRSNLADAVEGSGSEGIILHVHTTVNNSIEWLNARVNVKPTSA